MNDFRDGMKIFTKSGVDVKAVILKSIHKLEKINSLRNKNFRKYIYELSSFVRD